jgi:nuclear GTP-binding protein
LFQILRQFDVLHRDKKNISIGFIGYPNVGKSSIINTLKKQACCKAAPIPGETRVWQYVALTRRIYLIDCPGVVNEGKDDATDKILKSVLRAEKIEEPIEHISKILQLCKKEYIQKIYKITEWADTEDFVGQLAKSYGKLLKVNKLINKINLFCIFGIKYIIY